MILQGEAIIVEQKPSQLTGWHILASTLTFIKCTSYSLYISYKFLREITQRSSTTFEFPAYFFMFPMIQTA